MTSLPPEVPPRLRDLAHVVSAYNACLRLERSLQQAADMDEDVGDNMIYIRILGYLVHYVPTTRGLEMVIEEISSRSGESALLEVGKMYFDHYLTPFRAKKCDTPQSCRPVFGKITEITNATWVEAPQSYADARKNALIRDGHRCVVTGAYDTDSVFEIQELLQIVRSDPKVPITCTECAHIFGESTNLSIEPGSDKWNYAPMLWAIMRRFGYEELPDELDGSQIHRLENVMTLSLGFYHFFVSLLVWFVETPEKDTYKLETAFEPILRGYPEYVTFTTPDPVNLPVPSPTYLAIHATCAKVAQLSGAADRIEKLYEDMGFSTTPDRRASPK